MKPLANKETLDDLIFENRNKSYGAYYMRNTYNNSVKEAFSIALGSFVTIIFLVSHFAFKPIVKPEILDDNDATPTMIDYEIIPEKSDEPKAAAPKTNHTDVPDNFKAVTKITEPQKVTPGKSEVASPIVSKIDGAGIGGKLIIGGNAPGGESKQEKTVEGETLTYASKMPEFNGGEAALMRYITSNFKIPSDMEEGNIKLSLSFTVDEEGRISKINIVRSAGQKLDEEAIRVISGMPAWKPGEMNGRKVKVRFQVPIHIKFH